MALWRRTGPAAAALPARCPTGTGHRGVTGRLPPSYHGECGLDQGLCPVAAMLTLPIHRPLCPIDAKPAPGHASGLVRRGGRSAVTALVAASLLIGGVRPAGAQFEAESDSGGARLGAEAVHRYKVGVEVTAVGGACRGLFATIPVPLDWPEQQVRVVEEDISPSVSAIRYRTIDRSVKQMLVEIPQLARGETARATATFEVRRRAIVAPDDTSQYKIPKRLPRAIKTYLGPSPLIESRHYKIRSAAKATVAGKEGAWEKVEAIYDYVREHVQYKNGPLKGALRALRDGEGDCEELTSLFIAMCRAIGVPARTVWVPGHCYPEFYLVDAEGKGHWFPCQAAGTRAFGAMPEQRPILQKGDNFRVPEKPKQRQRYVAELLKGRPVKGGGRPKVRFIREMLD